MVLHLTVSSGVNIKGLGFLHVYELTICEHCTVFSQASCF